MPNSHDSPNPKQLAKLIKQLDQQCQLRLLKELAGTLSPHLLEAMKTEAEQERILRQLDGTEDIEELDEQPARHFEFKKIKHKYYAYLRWREDGRHKSEYLGPMPLLPGHTYTLTNKKDGNTKTLTPLSLELEDDQIYLKIKILKPVHTIRSYPYPECLDTIFSKKEWTVQQATSPLTEREETLNSNLSTSQDAPILLVKPEVRDAGESEPLPDTLKIEKAEPVQATTTRKLRSKPIRIPNPETLKNKGTPILEVPNKLVPQVYATLRQWEKLSQSLGSIPHWILVDKGNKITLRAAQENKTIMEYNRALGSVTSPHSAPVLIQWLQQIANVVSSSQLVRQDTKTQAIRLKTRLQGAPQDNSAVLLAYLLGIPTPKKRHYRVP
jgi:hypothetical protein